MPYTLEVGLHLWFAIAFDQIVIVEDVYRVFETMYKCTVIIAV